MRFRIPPAETCNHLLLTERALDKDKIILLGDFNIQRIAKSIADKALKRKLLTRVSE